MKWISVKSGLPEEEKRVLLFVIDKPYQDGGFWVCCGVRLKNEKAPSCFQLDGDDIADTVMGDREVTHWMPLPNPPVE